VNFCWFCQPAKSLIAITFLPVVGAGTAGTLLMPKQYEAPMKVLVKNDLADTVGREDNLRDRLIVWPSGCTNFEFGCVRDTRE
jgi:hypothetical protein